MGHCPGLLLSYTSPYRFFCLLSSYNQIKKHLCFYFLTVQCLWQSLWHIPWTSIPTTLTNIFFFKQGWLYITIPKSYQQCLLCSWHLDSLYPTSSSDCNALLQARNISQEATRTMYPNKTRQFIIPRHEGSVHQTIMIIYRAGCGVCRGHNDTYYR